MTSYAFPNQNQCHTGRRNLGKAIPLNDFAALIAAIAALLTAVPGLITISRRTSGRQDPPIDASAPRENGFPVGLASVAALVLGIVAVGLFVWPRLNTGPKSDPIPQAATAVVLDRIATAPMCATFSGKGAPPDGTILWLAVLSDEPKYYFFPVQVDVDRWRADNVTLGVVGEGAGEPFGISAILANESASDAIRGGAFESGISQLPSGATVADSMNIRRNQTNKPCPG